jgi:NAD(P)-dependent dehydrogenase (short-subunit alcohol dehydrogenase family)
MPAVLPPDERKVVFLTGCSSGIGKALALEYAERPGSRMHSRQDQINIKRYRVFAGVRNLESIRDMSPFIERIQIDVNSDESVKAAVDEIVREAGKIGQYCFHRLNLFFDLYLLSSPLRQTFSSTMPASMLPRVQRPKLTSTK